MQAAEFWKASHRTQPFLGNLIMAIGRVVPWSSWEEWAAVYRDLFADSVLQKNAALYQVLMVLH